MSSAPEKVDLDHGLHKDDVHRILAYAQSMGVSDIKFYTGEPVIFTWRKRAYPVTRRVLQNNEVENLARLIYGDNALAQLGKGDDIDWRYEFEISRGSKAGFRVNITSCLCNGESRALRATLRTLPGVPPELGSLKAPSEITDGLFPEHGGLVIVAGPTNSGKSTLLAAGIRHALEHHDSKCFLTYEDPIEFVYDQVNKLPGNLIAQQEIGKNLESFDMCGDNAMRSAPTDILVGESRTRQSLDSSMEFVLTGHTTYTTLHAQSVSMTFDRIIQKYPYEEQSGVSERLLASLRLIVIQRLLLRADGGGLVPVNEWLSFDRGVKAKLSGIKSDVIGRAVDKIVHEQGTSMAHHAAWRYSRGDISIDVACGCSGLSADSIEKMAQKITDERKFLPGELSARGGGH